VNSHPHYQDAVLLLAELHSTTPQIIHNAVHDTEHDYGLQIARELQIVLNYTEAIAGRKAGTENKSCTL
jgi:hypothetical protein